MVWCVVSRADGIPCILPASAHYAAESMVAQAGQPPGWPVSCEAGYLLFTGGCHHGYNPYPLTP